MMDALGPSLVRLPSLGRTASILTAVILAGCSRSSNPESAIAAANEQNIQRLANLYLAYQMKHESHGPPDEQAFTEFLHGYSRDKLTRIGVDPDNIDALFVSERDGQPFKVRYGVVGSMMGSSEPVIFEEEGRRGMRMVGFLNMVQREVDEAEYDDLWAGRTLAVDNLRTDAPDR